MGRSEIQIDGHSTRKMHADEVETNAALVRTLLSEQFPQWAGLPIAPVVSAGTDNAIYRLGGAIAVRLPRIHWAVAQVEKEQQWLPRLAPHLPLAIPTPLAVGRPGAGYPWPWAIVRWLAGENATLAHLANHAQAARDLAHFISALQQIDTAGAPQRSDDQRGGPLALRDAATRAAIASLEAREGVEGGVDTMAATRAWEAALAAPAWNGPPVWIHGDLQAGNLLAVHGRLSAVIDFGCLGVGDPACDLQVAWNLLPAASRAILRDAPAVDDATWARGRGWALSVALIQLPYYWETNPSLAANARATIAAVLAADA